LSAPAGPSTQNGSLHLLQVTTLVIGDHLRWTIHVLPIDVQRPCVHDEVPQDLANACSRMTLK
jgi:hypothetical protein